MDTLIKLAIYAAIAAAAYIAFDHYILGPAERRGAANQLAADQKVVNKLTTERDDARTQSTDALADVDACKASLVAQGNAVEQWKRAAKANSDAAAKARADGEASHQAATAAIKRYQEIASAPPAKDQTCQQKLDAVDKLLRDAAKARVK
jgi:hypothetical protein